MIICLFKVSLHLIVKSYKLLDRKYKDFRNIKVYAANVFEYAVMLKIIHENPFKYTKLPKRTRNKSNEHLTYYSSDELKQFLELIKDDLMYYAMFRLLDLLVCVEGINGFNLGRYKL